MVNIASLAWNILYLGIVYPKYAHEMNGGIGFCVWMKI